jgi:hypothetical protein
MCATSIDMFRCAVPAGQASQAVFNNLQSLVCADHNWRKDDRSTATVGDRLLNNAGVGV